MAGSLSIETQITMGMAEMKCTAAFLSGLTDFSQAKLSQGLSGLRPMTNEEGLTVLKQLDRMRRAAELFAPAPIAFDNPKLIKELLRAIDEGRIHVVITEVAPVKPAIKVYSIHMRDGRWFNGSNNSGKVTGAINFIGSLAVTGDVANQLLERLVDIGYVGCKKIENKFAGDEYFTDVDKAWGDLPKPKKAPNDVPDRGNIFTDSGEPV